jgi:hypothetical protein
MTVTAAPSRASAWHQETARDASEREQILVGQVAGVREARNRRHGRAGARADEEAAAVQLAAVHLDGVRTDEAGRAEDDVDPHRAERFGAVVLVDLGDHRLDMI